MLTLYIYCLVAYEGVDISKGAVGELTNKCCIFMPPQFFVENYTAVSDGIYILNVFIIVSLGDQVPFTL